MTEKVAEFGQNKTVRGGLTTTQAVVAVLEREVGLDPDTAERVWGLCRGWLSDEDELVASGIEVEEDLKEILEELGEMSRGLSGTQAELSTMGQRLTDLTEWAERALARIQPGN